jgi:hypothetical protein
MKKTETKKSRATVPLRNSNRFPVCEYTKKIQNTFWACLLGQDEVTVFVEKIGNKQIS